MRPKDCAYIVEHLSVRFMAMVADHSRQLAEHRAAFGARTEADAKIIEGLRVTVKQAQDECDVLRPLVAEARTIIDGQRASIDDLRNRLNALGIQAAKRAGEALGMVEGEGLLVAAQRDGLLAQVQDQRAEIERLKLACDTYAADWDTAGKACRIRVDEDPLSSVIRLVRDDAERAAVAKRLVKERDALRAEVADLRGTFDMVHASLGIKQGDHIGNAIEALKQQSVTTPKRSHPVAVGEWVRRTDMPSDQTPVGFVKQVTAIDCDGERYHFSDGDYWSIDNCEPCKRQHPAQNGQLVRRTVASGTHPVGAMIQIERSRTLHEEYVTRGGRVVPWAHCEPCDPPADHDTPAGKEAAEAAAEIKVDDVVEVVSASSCATFSTDIGRRGKVTYIGEKTIDVEGVPGYACPTGGVVSKRDVRKVPQ